MELREITAIDWRANRLADALAKEAAAEHAADASTVPMVKSSEEAARFHMALLGTVTHRSNHCPVQQLVGGELMWINKRDSLERPKAASTAQKRARHVHPKPLLEHRAIAVEPYQPASSPASCEQPSHAQRKTAAKRARAADLARASHAATERAVTALAERLQPARPGEASASERLAALRERIRLRASS